MRFVPRLTALGLDGKSRPAVRPRASVARYGIAGAQSLAAGEIAVGAFGNITAFKTLIDQGAPVKYVLPNPGLGFEYAMGGLAWSRRLNAALVLMDYVMSKAGQTAWSGTGEGASPRTDVPGAIPAAAITAWDSSAYPPDVVNKYRAYWSGIFK